MINHSIPNNKLGSRVMLTIHNHAVAHASCLGKQGMVNLLEPLSVEDSQSLLYKKSFQADVLMPAKLEEHL